MGISQLCQGLHLQLNHWILQDWPIQWSFSTGSRQNGARMWWLGSCKVHPSWPCLAKLWQMSQQLGLFICEWMTYFQNVTWKYVTLAMKKCCYLLATSWFEAIISFDLVITGLLQRMTKCTDAIISLHSYVSMGHQSDTIDTLTYAASILWVLKC